ncbi:hypothetical protein MXM41_16895 [Leclercia adecarboxylata]|uniref:hypothetical protein n=1 Tax=Leclercia adecarboxylata TaxID=83655 RepID=UPI002DB8C4CB|nr:hypothetical protein [Leclercia adecarboxylata]MEB6380598.1 hypothetical protein [Leclercia adecarboxylata]
MATTLNHTHALLTLPFNHSTAFTELADNCERFMDALVDCDLPAEKLALYGRLSACLALLQPTLLEPVPDNLKASLTVDDLPTRLPVFDPEPDQLGRYCQELTQHLMSGAFPAEAERVIKDLLYELVSFYADTLKMPRWLRTDEGTIPLN